MDLSKEKRLSAHCAKNKASAQKAVYDTYSAHMRGVCRRYIKSPDEAEDVLLEGFFKIFTQANKFVWKGKGTYVAWMKRVMINTAINYLKKNKQRSLDENIDEITEICIDENDGFFDNKLSRYTKEQVMNAFEKVPAIFGTVLNMAVVDGLKHKEIADMLGITEETSRSRLARARRMFKEALLTESAEVQSA